MVFGVVLNLSKTQRLLLGVFVLLLVVLIWVASSELTRYIFSEDAGLNFNKPFFTTYFKTSLFMLYLTGFIFWKPWRQQCGNSSQMVTESERAAADTEQLISEPRYIPVEYSDSERNSGTESDDSLGANARSVRFSKVIEVRQLSESQAEEANLARLSYTASVRAEEVMKRVNGKLSTTQVAKLAFFFCILWFLANMSYQEAIAHTQAGVVNLLSSLSAFFTLVLAAMFPSAPADRFSISKLLAVLVSISGVILVCFADIHVEGAVPSGAIWALCSAIFYAIYLVLLKKKAENEDRLDIAMFFGFVGLFNFLLLWPGFLILHYTGREPFEWPNREQWVFLCVNGIVGTVLSEFLWLWGCFLTTSLLATLALSLTIPATILADVLMKHVTYQWEFFVGAIPVFLSFIAVGILANYETWDPVLIYLKKFVHCICKRHVHIPTRLRDIDHEQKESLINSSVHES